MTDDPLSLSNIDALHKERIRMESLLSVRAKTMKASEIRELLKLTQRKDIISFAGGLPNPQLFPKEQMAEIAKDVIMDQGDHSLQYGTTEGYSKFREAIAERLQKNFGMDVNSHNVQITSGSQQGLDLLTKVFVNRGDPIIVGNPTYLGAANVFAAAGVKFETVQVDGEGMNPDDLEEKLRVMTHHGENPKFMYLVPTFDNPTGVTMPTNRRKKILDIAHEYDMLVVEDDPYSELRYEGDPVKSIKSMDKEGRVIYFGTISKIMTPGLRLAWTVASEPIIEKFTYAKQNSDLCTSALNQRIAFEFMDRGYLEPHIQKIIDMYKRKRTLFLKGMDEHFPEEVKYTRPDGGLFSWAICPPEVDTTEMFKYAIRAKVAYVTGKPFHVDGSGNNTLRLNFSMPSDEQIESGLETLGQVLRDALAHSIKDTEEGDFMMAP